jgi:two-component system chemotaxis sensor kinase CheA
MLTAWRGHHSGDGRVALILNVDTLVQGAVSAGFGLEAA